MSRGGSRKLRERPVLQPRLRWLTRRPRTRACYANGYGAVPSGRCARSITGLAVRFGRRGSTARRTRSRYPRVLIGICGLDRRRSARSTARTCRLCGAAGATSGVALWGVWVRTVSIKFFLLLKLEAPVSVEASSTERYEETNDTATTEIGRASCRERV